MMFVNKTRSCITVLEHLIEIVELATSSMQTLISTFLKVRECVFVTQCPIWSITRFSIEKIYLVISILFLNIDRFIKGRSVTADMVIAVLRTSFSIYLAA